MRLYHFARMRKAKTAKKISDMRKSLASYLSVTHVCDGREDLWGMDGGSEGRGQLL